MDTNDYNENVDRYNKAKDYYDKAQSCLEDASSPQCEDLLTEGAEKSLIAAGVDPAIASAAVECAKSRDREVCAKTSAKLAAVYGCTAATGGSGAYLCSELAPVLVDKMWPVIGPPLTKTWDVTLDVLEGVFGMLGGIIDSLGGLLGFGGGDGPTYTEKLNQLLWAGNDIVKPPLDSAVQTIITSDLESQASLGLIPDTQIGTAARKDGDLGRLTDLGIVDNIKPNENEIVERSKLMEKRANSVMTDNLRRHPGFGPINVFCLSFKSNTPASEMPANGYSFMDHRFTYTIVDDATAQSMIKKGALVLTSNAVPIGWAMDKREGWIPNGFKVHNPGKRVIFQQIRDAYGMILAERTRAIRDSTFKSVGDTIARNVQVHELQNKKPSSSPWLWLAALAGGGYLAYRYRDKIKKALT